MKVASVSGSPQCFTGWLVAPFHAKSSSATRKCKDIKFRDGNERAKFSITGGRLQGFSLKPVNKRSSFSTRVNNYQSSYEDLPPEPFMLTLIKEAIWGVKSLFAFLIEQPSQLKYIEWPGFQSTLRTAVLTLVIVAILIVALSSVDSVLCYLLALLLRRTA